MQSTLLILAAITLFMFPHESCAQNERPDSSFKVEIGFGGGAAFPMRDLEQNAAAGYNVGIKIRLRAAAPVHFLFDARFNHVPLSVYYMFLRGDPYGGYSYGYLPVKASLEHAELCAGLDIPIPRRSRQYAYISGQVLYTIFIAGSNVTSTLPSTSSGGAALGAGVVLQVAGPVFLDLGGRYSMLNILAQDPFEGNDAMLTLSATLMVAAL